MKLLGVVLRPKKQKGGVIPLAAVVPGLMAAGKRAGLVALGAVVGQKTKQWLKKRIKGDHKPSPVRKETTMRGGSLTPFKTDLEDQEGAGVIKETFKGGLKGAIKTRNPLKLPSNISKGAQEGFKKGLKRKAEQVLDLFPKQVKKVRDIFGK